MKKILVIDIGGSKIIVGLADFCGNILEYDKFQLPKKYDTVFLIGKICEMSQKYMLQKPVVAGVTIPGLADAEKGMWLYAPFSGISNFNICEILGQRLGIKVFCDNDVNACAIAEKRFGICKNMDNFLWITVSNGIGGAVYINGQIVYGDNKGAGEIGHFIVEENTKNKCGCGKIGCLEAMASGTGIAKEYKNVTGKELSAKESFYCEAIENCAKELIINIFRNNCHKSRNNNSQFYKNLISKINDEAAFITFDDAVQYSGYSASHFSKMFKRLSGMNFSEYINVIRVENAITMLRNNNNFSMTTISSKCGFSTVRNFNRVFKKITGYSPCSLPKNFIIDTGLRISKSESFDPTDKNSILI